MFDESDSQQVLVDIQDGRNDNGDGEVFLDEAIVQVKFFFDVLAVVVTVIPDIEVTIERKTFLGVLFLLYGEESFEFFVGGRAKFLLEVRKKLHRFINVSDMIQCHCKTC